MPEGQPADGETVPARRPRRRNRRPRDGAPPDAAAPGQERRRFPPRDRDGAPRDGRGERRARSPDAPGDDRRRAPGARGERREGGRRDDRHGARGRDGGARRMERKLYNLDSVVDRGFSDFEEEAGTRRVHWTIIKRTVADMITRKAMSATYVLQRDEAETEFSNLGAARSAVNKIIVHPEKLTRSKAEHVAEKKK